MSAEADDVEAGDAIDALGAAVVGDVFAEGAVALDDAGVADAQELVEDGAAANESAIADVDVAGEEGGVGDDVVGANDDVVAEVQPTMRKLSEPSRVRLSGLLPRWMVTCSRMTVRGPISTPLMVAGSKPRS